MLPKLDDKKNILKRLDTYDVMVSRNAQTKSTQHDPNSHTADAKSSAMSISQALGNLLGKEQRTNDDPKNLKSIAPRNELSELIPGYIAPLRLIPKSNNNNNTNNATTSKITLEQLRRQVLTEETSKWNIPTSSSPSSKNYLQKVNVTTSSSTTKGKFLQAVASFKDGHKKKRTLIPQDAGDGWFGMKASPMTDDVKRDITLIKNRNYLDPKRFYKSSDRVSNIVQVGTVIEDATEYYSSRLTKKQRRSNLTEEIMADTRLRDYAINKFKDMSRKQQQEAEKRRKSRKKK